MKRKSLEELLGNRIQEPYDSQYHYIMQLIDEGKIKPVRASGKNGKKPALYTEYHILEEKSDYSGLEEELLYQTDPLISVDYYVRHPQVYLKERESVRLLDQFLKKRKDRLKVEVSFNERCFEIWGYEKFLSKAAGKTLLKHCGLDLYFLNCYPTAEPFAYYAHSRMTPQKILILENKDPFFSMRKHLLSGKDEILGEKIGTLIYGAGKRVVSSFQEFSISAEPYMKEAGNELLYFGDLDYEGIGIYENLARTFENQGRIKPFRPAYISMLKEADNAPKLPASKEQQNRNIDGSFFSYFDEQTVRDMKKILEKDLYIPQEILNISDF
jgi:hypothetical protein